MRFRPPAAASCIPLRFAIPLAMVLGAAPLPAQQGYPGGFPYDAFTANERVARWLAEYDRIAWITTDSLRTLPDSARASAGPDWLCIQDGSRWHALYGTYDSTTQRYRLGVHYVVDHSSVRRSVEPLDTAEATVLARGLLASRRVLPPIARINLLFNRYVRRLPDRRVEVWYLPAWQPNGVLVEGAEMRYGLDSTAGRITDSTVRIGKLWAHLPDTGVVMHIDDRSREAAGVGPLFVLLAYGWAYKNVYIENRRFRTALYRGPGPQAWIHALRPPEAAPPESR